MRCARDPTRLPARARLAKACPPHAHRLLLPALLLGFFSVFHWHRTDDLRLYVVVQFYPLLIIPLLLAIFPPAYTHAWRFIVALILYVAAKVVEVLDKVPAAALPSHSGLLSRVGAQPIFRLTRGAVSGHTLKHLLAAAGVHQLAVMIQERKPA